MKATNSKEGKKAKPVEMPSSIRNELRMTVALRGLSSLRQWDSMTIRDQYEWMNSFIHGKPNIAPSQLKLIADGVADYRNLYEEKNCYYKER